MTSTILVCLLQVLLIGSDVSASVKNKAGRRGSGVVGLKAGLFSRSEFKGDKAVFRTQVGSTAELLAEFPLGREFYLTTAFDFYYIQIVNDNQIMLEPSLGLKRIVNVGFKRTRFKPGIAFGYAHLARINALRPSDYFAIKGMLETHFTINPRRTWMIELAVFKTFEGGNGDFDLKFGPVLMLRVGFSWR